MTMIMEGDENGSSQKGALNNNSSSSSSTTTINSQSQQQQSMIFSTTDQHNNNTNNSSIQLSTNSMNNDIQWAFSQIKGPLDEEIAEGMWDEFEKKISNKFCCFKNS